MLQQAGLVLRALELGVSPFPCIIRWADRAIISEQSPPQWLLDLSLLDASHFADIVIVLRKHAERMESRELDVCILAHVFFAGQLSIQQLFERGFSSFFSYYDVPISAPFEQLANVLCDWDQMDLPDLNQGDWRRRISKALAECQRASGELPAYVAELYAA